METKKEEKKVKIYHQEKFEIDGKMGKIRFTNEKATTEEKGEEYITFGRTYHKHATIDIYVDNLNGGNKSIIETLYHEIGHAVGTGMPSHSDFGEGSNIMATGFEGASRYSKKIDKVYKNYKAKVKK